MKPLCYRCEHRARYHEEGHAPRYECGQIDHAVASCYMYQPVAPVVCSRNEGDDRPAFAGAMLSARVHGVRVAEGKYKAMLHGDEITVHWAPKEDR